MLAVVRQTYEGSDHNGFSLARDLFHDRCSTVRKTPERGTSRQHPKLFSESLARNRCLRRHTGECSRGLRPELYSIGGLDDGFPGAEDLGQTCARDHITGKTASVVPGQATLSNGSSAGLYVLFHTLRDFGGQHHGERKKQNLVLPQAVSDHIFRMNEIDGNVLLEKGAVKTQQ